MNILHLPIVEGKKWAKLNPDTNLYEFFTCVDSGYYKQEDYTQVTDEWMQQYIEENYPKEEEIEEEEEILDSSIDSSMGDSSVN